jgi:amino acid permease
VLNALMGCGRSLYHAVHDWLLPRFSEYTNRHGTPDYAMAFNRACSVMVVFVASRLENYGYLISAPCLFRWDLAE